MAFWVLLPQSNELPVKGYFIYDDSDKGVEFLTEGDFIEAQKKLGITKQTKVISVNKELLARFIVACGGRMTLFKNKYFSMEICYNQELSVYIIDFIGSIKYSVSIFSIATYNSTTAQILLYRRDNFYWERISSNKAKAVVPEYYAECLINNETIREREIRNILSKTTLTYTDNESADCRRVKAIELM